MNIFIEGINIIKNITLQMIDKQDANVLTYFKDNIVINSNILLAILDIINTNTNINIIPENDHDEIISISWVLNCIEELDNENEDDTLSIPYWISILDEILEILSKINNSSLFSSINFVTKDKVPTIISTPPPSSDDKDYHITQDIQIGATLVNDPNYNYPPIVLDYVKKNDLTFDNDKYYIYYRSSNASTYYKYDVTELNKLKIKKQDIKNEINTELQKALNYELDYKTDYDYDLNPNIFKFNSDLLDTTKLINNKIETIKTYFTDDFKKPVDERCSAWKYHTNWINKDVFDSFSILNTGLLFKLLLIILNPENFCSMWYTDPFDKDTAFKFIITIINAFFIKAYDPIDKNRYKGNKEFEEFIKRDTKICKALLIQNFQSYKNKYLYEIQKELDNNNITTNDHEYKFKFINDFIEEQTKQIKLDKTQYIFSYKLLIELPIYYSKYNVAIVNDLRNLNKSSNIEFLFEIFYYSSLLEATLTKLLSLHAVLKETSPIKHSDIINENYLIVSKTFNKVLSFVKERNDSEIIPSDPKTSDNTNKYHSKHNPRYEITLTSEDMTNLGGTQLLTTCRFTKNNI
jgi:hypothetical protein